MQIKRYTRRRGRFRLPVTETVISHIAEPANVPDPINLRLKALAVRSAAINPTVADDYGEGDSIVLSRPDPDPAGAQWHALGQRAQFCV